VLALLADLVTAGEPYAIEPRWEGTPVLSPLRALAIARDDAHAAYVDASFLQSPKVSAAL